MPSTRSKRSANGQQTEQSTPAMTRREQISTSDNSQLCVREVSGDNPNSSISQLVQSLSKTVEKNGQDIMALQQIPDAIKELTSQIKDIKNYFQTAESLCEEDTDETQNDPEDQFDLLFNKNENETTDTDNDILRLLSNVDDEVEFGQPLNDIISKKFERLIQKQPTKEGQDSYKESLKVPENCKLLGVPKVNTEIWSQLQPKLRTSDLKLQYIQQSISKGLVAFATVAQHLSEQNASSSAPAHCIKIILDGANALSFGHRELSHKRRQDIRPDINIEYAGICSSQIPVTEFLFGDNLAESLKQTKSVCHIVKNTGKEQRRPENRFTPYKYPNKFRKPLNFQRTSFRFQRGGVQNQRFQNRNQNKNYNSQQN